MFWREGGGGKGEAGEREALGLAYRGADGAAMAGGTRAGCT